ncbi:MAG: deoxyguanosinetriphosphate triphosphohydrolase [Candidatus Tectomicrobia bacterium]|uniref:Deoxyguanosinetriphosphate triphosphohydrolase-like protein n=1 Tax=Tectimicrobiota bacterium TaxID=2528274 RepID=A0A932CLS5_UNCTE|nr:deoxyguanosinetriphosphate triphosphohydrolase [Candidatus Tectomicrobia bacterium]
MISKIRACLEENEKKLFSPKATFSAESRGRERPEPECDVRTAFQHDRDRIIHSKAFRRLKHKTQVFLSPSGDHYRTRLTHTLEVSQIARTVARALRLNEDLTEAISMGHDLGHTPFGHAGEAVLNRIHPGGFKHAEQSLRVVDLLERDGQGLNLTWEVRQGILYHSKGLRALFDPQHHLPHLSLEAQIVRLADSVAYVNHDLDDAVRAELIGLDDVPQEALAVLGRTSSQRINTMVRDLIQTCLEQELAGIQMSPQVLETTEILRRFLYHRVYNAEKVHQEFLKASKILEELYGYFVDHPPDRGNGGGGPPEPRNQGVCDYIAGMSDSYALELYGQIFLPRPWKGREEPF